MIVCSVALARPFAYFAGEHITAKINFTNNGTEEDSIMWVSAQIHCHLAFSQRYVRLPPDADLTFKGKHESGQHSSDASGRSLTPSGRVIATPTSLQDPFAATRAEAGKVVSVYSSTANVLACDLKLGAGESVDFIYRELIPDFCPPTFRGVAVRYGYYITIGMQRFGQATSTLKAPFKVYPLPTFKDETLLRQMSVVSEIGAESLFDSLGLDDDGSGDLQLPKNNEYFLEAIKAARRRLAEAEAERANNREADSEDESDKGRQTQSVEEQDAQMFKAILNRLAASTSRSSARSKTYNIGNGDIHVCTFTLYKHVLRLGEQVLGVFDFENATLPCHHISVTLEMVEKVKDKYEAKGPFGQPKPAVQAEHHEYCRFAKRTYFDMCIPLRATPSMDTNIEPRPPDETEDVIISAPESVNVQTMTWSLPVEIYPTNPANLPGDTIIVKGEY